MGTRSNEEGLELFLKTLDPDRDLAAEKYLALRERLERYFEWRGRENVEGLTDRVFDRVIKKVTEDVEIENVGAYCTSVAKFVLLENRREGMRDVSVDENAGRMLAADSEQRSVEGEIKSKRFDCLDKCMEEFPFEKRDLLIRYFDTDDETLIPSRKKLASEIGVNLNSLRIRISRLKTKLERCTKDCCARDQSLERP